jgi:hypothetical protein
MEMHLNRKLSRSVSSIIAKEVCFLWRPLVKATAVQSQSNGVEDRRLSGVVRADKN